MWHGPEVFFSAPWRRSSRLCDRRFAPGPARPGSGYDLPAINNKGGDLMTFRFFLGAVLLACACTGWGADGRVALVAGNNDYASGSKLVNAVSDAKAMAQVLRAAGWEVLEIHDATHADFEAAFAKFLGQLGKGGEGVFYFSGHGLELGRQNFLLPVDFDGSSAEAAARKAIPLQDLIRRISAISPRAVAMILDACRANPALKGLMPRPGLGEVAQAVPAGMFMLYGAGAGQTRPGPPVGQRSGAARSVHARAAGGDGRRLAGLPPDRAPHARVGHRKSAGRQPCADPQHVRHAAAGSLQAQNRAQRRHFRPRRRA